MFEDKGVLYSIDDINIILKKFTFKRILLVTGKNSFLKSGSQKKLESLLLSHKVMVFNQFTINPKYDDVINGVEFFKKNSCDFIIAVGGGSVIDFAKSVNAFVSSNKDIEQSLLTSCWEFESVTPLVAIPTTSGSGSEATHFSVIYYKEKKYSIAHKLLKPVGVILDSTLSYSLSPYMTACTGFDALSQAIESYWSISSTRESRIFSEKSILLILNNIHGSVKGSCDARDRMCIASHLSGQAINVTKTTAPHALSYYLTTQFNIPHGHAVALLLGVFLEQFDTVDSISVINDIRGIEYFKRMRKNLLNILSSKSCQSASADWYSLMRKCGLNTSLGSFGVKIKDIPDYVNGIDASRLSNHPVKYTKNGLSGLIKSLFSHSRNHSIF